MSTFVQRLYASSPALRWGVIVLICIVATGVVATLGPIPQSQAYHDFADARTFFGIPRAFDVLSNLPFCVVGLLGLAFTLHPRSALEQSQRWAYAVLFAGLLLTGFGSAYYHLAPDNQRLVWDRLPMTVAMAGVIAALLNDRFGGRSVWLMPVLLALGAGTVLQWHFSEQQGFGDLRWYALYQGLTIICGTALLALFPSRREGTREFVIAVVANIAAKIFELLDKPIYQLGGIVSGHTLKHLSAGLGFLPLALLMYRAIGRERNQAVLGKSA